MKKVLSVLLMGLLALSLAACGGKPAASATPTPDGGADDKTPTEGKTRIALVLPYIGDQSYFDVTYNGLKLVQEEYGDKVETKLIEMGADEAGWASAYLQATQDGYDVIISGNFQYESYMLDVAAQFPDIKFLNFDYSDPALNDLANVYGVNYASHEIGYLAGVVAAVKSESGIIGGIGGMEINGIKQFLGGYIQGALAANPDIKVITSFVGDFVDTGKAKEIAQNMNKEGADVIFHAAGGAGNGMFEAASQGDFWAIGVDTDQYTAMSKQPELAKKILTSGMKNCDQAILNSVGMILDGTCPFGTLESLDYASGGVGLAENDYYKANMTADQLAEVKVITDKLMKHEVTVIDCATDLAQWDTLTAKVAK